MKPMILARLGAGVFVVTLALTACAAPQNLQKETSMDLQTAEGIALAMEDEIAALLPSENVGDQTQQQTSPLLKCADDRYRWSGRTVVTFTGEVDTQGIVDGIAAAWKLEAGVNVEEGDATGDDAEVDLRVVDGGSYNAAIWNSGTQLYITSFSPCFELEEGQHPSDEY
ncbi:hypothetical protein [Cryobacterium sp. PH31-L1]|uniref:hypothetical protein n=1 Tax=Cryobacterium sp. PH31-L1 TaxID=3046199 RepID=UPI0024BA7B4D|nr:hypothetical protein [Cryobacterium sp. PH31-L1]MDJ0378261.1 hypothetical protein [Cryobacterium sp. PH31-L1]